MGIKTVNIIQRGLSRCRWFFSWIRGKGFVDFRPAITVQRLFVFVSDSDGNFPGNCKLEKQTHLITSSIMDEGQNRIYIKSLRPLSFQMTYASVWPQNCNLAAASRHSSRF